MYKHVGDAFLGRCKQVEVPVTILLVVLGAICGDVGMCLLDEFKLDDCYRVQLPGS